MFEGKTKAALRLLSEQSKGGVLHLDDPIETENGQRKVRDILLEKHPPCQPVHNDAIINDDTPDVHPVLLESLDAAVIRSAALYTSGAAWNLWSRCTWMEKAMHFVQLYTTSRDFAPPLLLLSSTPTEHPLSCT